jgi:hypothetical protein
MFCGSSECEDRRTHTELREVGNRHAVDHQRKIGELISEVGCALPQLGRYLAVPETLTLMRGTRAACCGLMVQDRVAGVLVVVPAGKTMSPAPISHRSRAFPVSSTNCCHHCAVRGGGAFLTATGAAAARSGNDHDRRREEEYPNEPTS